MGDYQQIPVKRFPKPLDKLDDETQYWKSFKKSCHFKEFAPVTSVEFSPVKPYDFCIASSTRLKIYSPRLEDVKRTFSRFQDVANCGSFRSDGRLVVAGDNSGTVQIFNVEGRSILRSFKEHSAPVHSTRFLSSNTQIISAGDDKIVKLYDIPAETVVCSYENIHTDYVRSSTVSHSNPNLFATGSYDHTVRIWDSRSREPVMKLDHVTAPVESLLFFPGDSLLASTAGNELFIWDILGSSRDGNLLQRISNHQKTVTCLAFNSNHSRLITGSLDQQVKVYNVTNYTVTHSFKETSPILAIAVSPDDQNIVTGSVSGLISVRDQKRRSKNPDDGFDVQKSENKQQTIWQLGPRLDTNSKSQHELEMASVQPGTYKFFLRGRHKLPSADDYVVASKRGDKIQKYEKFLKSFEYSRALDAAMYGGRHITPEMVISLLEELERRPKALQTALSGRDEAALDPILRFILRNIKNPRFGDILINVLNIILDIYESVLHSSPVIESLVMAIMMKVRQEVGFQSEMHELLGSMDMIMAVGDLARI